MDVILVFMFPICLRLGYLMDISAARVVSVWLSGCEQA